MFLNGQRYFSLSAYFKNEFKSKLIKLPLDAGLSCPNRDGNISTKACLFCNEEGSGDFTSSSKLSITEQINEQKEKLKHKFSSKKYIAYFQSFTNTYGDINYLKKIFYEALESPDIVGISIATRPDCLDENVLDLLNDLNQKTFLWLELGLQSIHENTALLINRGYNLDCFLQSYEKLRSLNIKTVVHLILGLPYEEKIHMIESVKFISKLKPWGVKFHLLYIAKNSALFSFYNSNPFHILSLEEYVDIVSDSISYLHPDTIIHRLTGDGNKEFLFKPLWSTDKKKVLNFINKTLRQKNIIQGSKFNL